MRYPEILNCRMAVLLTAPLAGAVVFSLGESVVAAAPEALSETVSSARTWLAVFSALHILNLGVAWFFRHHFAPTAARMLVAGVFAYIAISAIVALISGIWGSAGQLFGGAGSLDEAAVVSVRYALICWSVSLVSALIGIGISFEDSSASEKSVG
jgi:hypothetical protein